MFRRSFLKALGIGGSAGFFTARSGEAGPAQRDGGDRKVGAVDLDEIEIIDVHVHPPNPMTLEQSYDAWNSSFVDALLPAYDYPAKEELRSRLSGVFEEHLYRMPRQIGYYNYVARVYGVEPTLAGFDAAMKKNLQGDFTDYIRSILDREKIPAVVLQSRSAEPRRPESHLPGDRFVWTYSIGDLIQPTWPSQQGERDLGGVLERIDRILEAARNDRCVGLKIPIAYYRPLSIEPVERSEAERALGALLAAEPSGARAFPGPIPLYEDAELTRAVRAYQDFLLKHIYVKAGELDLRIIIHSAVALHPALRFDYNSPVDLYHVFQDDEIKRAYTQFVLIHTGYPYHHHVAAMLSQFPNVYTDVSFYSKFPGTLEETLRAFLALAPSEKVMHGSDANNVPEEIGYCAENCRRILAKVLADYRGHYGWTEKDCERMARNVMSENARRVYGIPS